MKNVVFSEGKNDVFLLTEIHDRIGIDAEYDYYLTEDASIGQTKWLRQHHADARFKYLYKSEEGDGNLIKQFKSHSLMFSKFSLCILVDLDDDPFSNFVDELNSKLYEDYGNKVQVEVNSRDTHNELYIADTTLKIERTEDRNLPIIAFFSSLEEVIGISSGDDRATKERKISNYLDENDDIVSAIEPVIFTSD